MTFEEFFGHLWKDEQGKPLRPFPWQRELARRIENDGHWPSPIEAPTSAGKTALIDIAVYALAMEWKAASTRIFFVVDRRIVVDEAKERADVIADQIQHDPGLSNLKMKLAALSDADRALHVSVMRGGMPLETAWAKSPTQPTICLTTVDQLGSRLLFRGYGVSRKMAAIHAGLAATDSLVILDEAHLSEPFRQTLNLLKLYRSDKWCECVVGKPLQITFISATLPKQKRLDDRNAFEFKETYQKDEEPSDVLKRRLDASKQTILVAPIGNWKPPNQTPSMSERKRWNAQEPDRKKAFASQVCQTAVKSLNLEYRPRAIGVILNRVGTARAVHEQLSEWINKNNIEADAILLTGRCRPIDRDWLITRYWKRIKANRHRSPEDRPIFVVATQCIEAGANLDFDALVTEIASLDALRQRFGRLDRLGDLGITQAWIVTRSDSVKIEDDPVYGEALCNSFKLLQTISPTTKKPDKKKAQATSENCLGFGIQEFKLIQKDLLHKITEDEFKKLKKKNAKEEDESKKRKEQDLRIEASEIADKRWAGCLAPQKKAPVLMPSHLDYLAQANPRPAPDPDPAIFLHGPKTEPADLNLIWRSDLPAEIDDWIETLSLVPPSSAESLSLPFGVAKTWLLGRLGQDFSDVEGETVGEDEPTRENDDNLPISLLIWRGKESIVVSTKAEMRERLRPGDTVVLPSSAGGLDEYGWNPASRASVTDIADIAHSQQKGRSTLRFHPSVFYSWQEGTSAIPDEEFASLRQILKSLRLRADDEARDFPLGKVNEILVMLVQCMWLRSDIHNLVRNLSEQGFRQQPYPDGSGWIITSKKKPNEKPVYLWEDDDCSFADSERKLSAHIADVESVLNRWLKRFSFPEVVGNALKSFPQMHDLGKADPRFQDFLYGGRHEGAGQSLLAKSEEVRLTKNEFQTRWKECELQPGWRHELTSLDVIHQTPSCLDHLSKKSIALLLHLIATHHGFCRAVPPVINDPNAPPVSASFGAAVQLTKRTAWHRLDSGLIDQFACLQRQFGWHGLAFLEAIVRLADHVASAKLNDHDH